MSKLKMNRLLGIVAVVAAVLIQACSADEETFFEKQVKKDDQLISEYLEANQIEANKTVDGVYYQSLVANESGDRPGIDEIVYIYYKISLLSGDSITGWNESMGAPVRFQMNKNNVIPYGINSGVSLMRTGEKFRLFMPAAQGYWNYESNDIPAYSNLIVEVELVSTVTELEQKSMELDLIDAYVQENGISESIESYNSGLYIHRINDGVGDKPLIGESVKVKYKGMLLDGTVFDQTQGSQTFTFKVGGNSTIPGWEEGIPKLNKGTKALLIIPSHLAYGKRNALWLPQEITTDPIPPFSPLVFEVEVLNP